MQKTQKMNIKCNLVPEMGRVGIEMAVIDTYALCAYSGQNVNP